jgi:GDPmannose 4,6-dehydratase
VPTALVTGVLGQDGSLLAELLLARGYRVIGIARPGKTVDPELRPLVEQIQLVEIDLTGEPTWVEPLLAREKPDEVYHLAAAHRSSEGTDDAAMERRMYAVNHALTVALADALLAAGRGRLVSAGSSQMYTPAIPPPRIDETTLRAPSTIYGVTKAKALDELATRRAQGLHASTAILFNHESPRRPAKFVSRKITLAAARIAAGLQQSLVIGDLAMCVDFSSAHDIVRGLHAMALADAPQDLVLASGRLRSIAELCDVAFTAIGHDARAHVSSTQPAGERPALVGNPARAEQALGWKAERAFADWVAEMVSADRRRVAEGAP